MACNTRPAMPEGAPGSWMQALPMAAWLTAALLVNQAQAAGESPREAGIWTLSIDGANRACRISLRDDAVGAGWGVAMPPGCRRVLPALKTVQAWAMPSDDQVSLVDADAQAVMVFSDQDTRGLHATDATGLHVTLSPYRRSADAAADDGPIVALAPTGAVPVTTLQAADPPSPAAPVVRVANPVVRSSDLAGHYAVLRGDRDTGCMVTLDAGVPGPKRTLKAHLAPACRDQGIIIFDPLGWQIDAGRLVLTARKGHTLELNRTPEGVWVKDGKDGKVAFGLKPI